MGYSVPRNRADPETENAPSFGRGWTGLLGHPSLPPCSILRLVPVAANPPLGTHYPGTPLFRAPP